MFKYIPVAIIALTLGACSASVKVDQPAPPADTGAKLGDDCMTTPSGAEPSVKGKLVKGSAPLYLPTCMSNTEGTRG